MPVSLNAKILIVSQDTPRKRAGQVSKLKLCRGTFKITAMLYSGLCYTVHIGASLASIEVVLTFVKISTHALPQMH